jgi:hypothetical protein
LSCHTEAARQIQATTHWTWDALNPWNRQRLGKRNVINTFCIGVPSNYPHCTACHVGYGFKDEDFDLPEQDMDCLVCHDQTGTYKKIPGLSGNPAYRAMEYPPFSGKRIPPVDLRYVAQHAGATSRRTCGACHFYGGGGSGVKHGDLDSSLHSPSKSLDVHMDAKGLNFSCATCHMTTAHKVPGSRYAPTAIEHLGAIVRGEPTTLAPEICRKQLTLTIGAYGAVFVEYEGSPESQYQDPRHIDRAQVLGYREQSWR